MPPVPVRDHSGARGSGYQSQERDASHGGSPDPPIRPAGHARLPEGEGTAAVAPPPLPAADAAVTVCRSSKGRPARGVAIK